MPNLVKIGATNSCPKKRLKIISNQSVPYPFELVATFESEDCLEFEQYCHNSLRSKLEAKEFFKVNKKHAIELIEILATTYQKKAKRIRNALLPI